MGVITQTALLRSFTPNVKCAIWEPQPFHGCPYLPLFTDLTQKADPPPVAVRLSAIQSRGQVVREHGRPQDFLQVGSNCGLDGSLPQAKNFLKVVCCCTRVLVHFLVN